MTTITATPDTATASVRLEISTSSPVSKVLRNDVNGVAEVRTLQDQLPTPLTDNEYRRNLITNPSSGVDTAGWTVNPGTGGAAAITRQTDGGHAGPHYMRAAWTTGTTAANAAVVYTQPVTGVADTNYILQLKLRNNSNSTTYMRPKIEFLDANSAVVGIRDAGGYFAYGNSTFWDQLSFSGIQATANFTQVRVSLQFSYNFEPGHTPAAGYTFDVDAMLLEKSDTTDASSAYYFDGEFDEYTLDGVPVPGTLSWTGTPHASQSIIKNSGTLILTDYEAAAGLNSYSVVEGTDTGASASVELVLDQPWLLVPILPNYSEQVQTITNYGSQRLTQSTVHSVIGRTDPLVAFGVLGSRTGTMEIFCESLLQARKLETVFNRGEVVMLKQNVDGMDMYFTGNSTTVNPYAVEGEEFTRYALTVQYTELKRPIGNLAGALGWTFDELARSYASFNELVTKFATFNDLTIRKEK